MKNEQKVILPVKKNQKYRTQLYENTFLSILKFIKDISTKPILNSIRILKFFYLKTKP